MVKNYNEKELQEQFKWFPLSDIQKSGYNYGPTCLDCIHTCTEKKCQKPGGPIYFQNFKQKHQHHIKSGKCNECLFKHKFLQKV